MGQEKVEEIVRLVNNRDEGAVKVAIDTFVKQHPTLLLEFVNRILQDDISSQASRSALSHFAVSIKTLDSDQYESVANHTLSKMKSSANNFDEADFIIRDGLFSTYLKWGQFSDAAQSLAGLNVESTTRPYTDNEKADIYVKCAEAFLADDASVDAEVFVNKARQPMDGVTEWTLKLRYKVVLARILDANRKFTEAAKQYYELSTLANQDVRC